MDVLDGRRPGKGVGDELAPFLPIGAAGEILGVVLDRVPGHEQPIALRLLERPLQRECTAALGALEQRRGLRDAGLELGFLGLMSICAISRIIFVPALVDVDVGLLDDLLPLGGF